ncbi:MAG: hypothetical protein OYH76_14870, partial [Defluviicoccus sp.]|nr:hypothetical protein [Defluviicoccus sp.]MDE0277174.1 hypothetical protein [Defluviicoccus sp.]
DGRPLKVVLDGNRPITEGLVPGPRMLIAGSLAGVDRIANMFSPAGGVKHAATPCEYTFPPHRHGRRRPTIHVFLFLFFARP